MQISKSDIKNIKSLSDVIAEKLDKATTLQEASQIFVKEMYNMFKDSIVLLRLFATITMEDLPAGKQDFVTNLAKGAGLKVPLDPKSYILTLFGSMGENPDWHDISKSQGHQGIPLATADFVSAIPMISALLEQLGFDLGWIRGEPEIVAKAVGKMSGVFYVSDAPSSKDSKGRHIIAAQDYVKKYGVKTVFGIGGGYPIGGKFLTVICFTRDEIDKEHTLQFSGLANIFKSKTAKFINDKGKHFG